MKIEGLTPIAAALDELGARLARVRKQQGYTQEALAERAGVGVATVRRIEDGQDSKLGSWIRLLLALDMAAAIDAILPENYKSPMEEAKRARKRGSKPIPGTGFVWGDERK